MARTVRDVDLCALVKACAEAGVAEFKYGQIVIRFGDVWPKQAKEIPGAVVKTEEPEQNRTLGDRDEGNVRELQESELMLLDPLAYEKMHTGGEI